MRGAASGRPPPIFESWNAAWIARAASAASGPSTANEMLRSDEPCAIATTLMLLAASAENTRAAMPGAPAMPSPTTATTAMPGRAVTLSMSPLASSSRNACADAARRRARASVSGSVKPIELSDEAWKIVETERRSASTAANVRAAMPCTPTMPLPATVTIAWPCTMASALTGYAVERPARRDLGAGRRRDRGTSGRAARCACRRSGSARADAAPWRRSARLRPPRGGAAAGCRRASGTRRGSAVRIPGTSFHSTTRRAPSERREQRRRRDRIRRVRASSTLPSGAASDEAGHDRRWCRPRAAAAAARRARRAGLGEIGAALPCWPSVTTNSVGVDVRRAAPAARDRRGQDRGRHPFAARDEQVARAWLEVAEHAPPPRTGRGTRAPRRRSRRAAAPRGRPAGTSALATWRCRRRKTAASAAGSSPFFAAACCAPPRSRSVMPPSAEATTTSGPVCAAMSAAARANRCSVRKRCAAEFPDL